ncbi:MAG: hypothetical protein IH784_03050 [Bacteroidetes bacterium]|nr:hypothetical protein [Bacteroidota bacterium]
MKFNFNNKSTLQILFGAALILLIPNLVLDIIDNENNSISNKTELSSTEIDSLFRLSLHSFGLLDDWIKESKSSKLDKSYKVKIPKDLSIPVILVEINSNFWETDVTISSVEKIFSGRTILEIKSKDEIKLRADFDYDKSIFRSAGTAAFILENFELSSFEDSLLLDIPEPFSPLLIPSTENLILSKFIIDKQKTFSLLLNDDIPELKYKLKDSYSQNRLKRSLLSIINDFSSATYFFIDDRSDLFNSSVFSYLKDELVKRKIKIVKVSYLQKLNFSEMNVLISSFDTFMKNTEEGKSITFLISADNFRNLLPEIKSYRKVGYKIVHPSETIPEENIN